MRGIELFINFSNHPSDNWSNEQKRKAIEMAKQIVDVSFPDVSPEDSEEQVEKMAGQYVEQILRMKPDVVMCQGEFTLCYCVIQHLINQGIKVVAAVSRRETIERKVGDKTEKKSVFKFVGFREYRNNEKINK